MVFEFIYSCASAFDIFYEGSDLVDDLKKNQLSSDRYFKIASLTGLILNTVTTTGLITDNKFIKSCSPWLKGIELIIQLSCMIKDHTIANSTEVVDSQQVTGNTNKNYFYKKCLNVLKPGLEAVLYKKIIDEEPLERIAYETWNTSSCKEYQSYENYRFFVLNDHWVKAALIALVYTNILTRMKTRKTQATTQTLS